VPAPPILGPAALPAPRFPRIVLPALALLATVALVLVMAAIAVVVGIQPVTPSAAPSGLARAEIPPQYLRFYQEIGARYGIDPWILAGIGWIETQHGTSTAQGVHSGRNAFGCCAGPMQISLEGTWQRFRVDGDGDGRMSVYDPGDAIATAARYLKASGAPGNYHRALFAYNHAEWYVAEVLAKADEYRGAMTGELPGAPDGVAPATESIRRILANHRITLTPSQRTDVRSGALDPRLLAALAWTGERHAVVITALKSDHSRTTVDGNVSNHSAGRAMDIGAVDGEICRGTRTGRCATLVHQLAAGTGPLRSTELIYCWDPDGPKDPRGFARADHCDHIHVGWDA
jgi:hypothetical protein